MSTPPPPSDPSAPAPWSPAPPPGRSNKAKFWIGAGLAVPAVVVLAVVVGGISAAAEAVVPGVAQALTSVLLLGGLVALVMGVVVERTRWYAIGAFAALGLLAIVAAGACLALLVSLSASYN